MTDSERGGTVRGVREGAWDGDCGCRKFVRQEQLLILYTVHMPHLQCRRHGKNNPHVLTACA